MDSGEERRRDREWKCGEWCENESGERRVNELLLVVERPGLRARIRRGAMEYVPRSVPDRLVVEAELLACQVAGDDEKNE